MQVMTFHYHSIPFLKGHYDSIFISCLYEFSKFKSHIMNILYSEVLQTEF